MRETFSLSIKLGSVHMTSCADIARTLRHLANVLDRTEESSEMTVYPSGRLHDAEDNQIGEWEISNEP